MCGIDFICGRRIRGGCSRDERETRGAQRRHRRLGLDPTCRRRVCARTTNGTHAALNLAIVGAGTGRAADYIQDDFNLTGLSATIPYYEYALDVILDAESSDVESLEEEQQDLVQNAAEILYGLIHARFIITNRGLAMMADKFASAGACRPGRPQGLLKPVLTLLAPPAP